ncbi:MAG: hypothetical protein Q7T73_06715 [Beijerinckiaceae bacterium]|nr:hypothetical protein [Beijerinckiaceae bacterium]
MGKVNLPEQSDIAIRMNRQRGPDTDTQDGAGRARCKAPAGSGGRFRAVHAGFILNDRKIRVLWSGSRQENDMGVYQFQLSFKLGDAIVQRVYEERIEARTDTDAIALAHYSLAQAPVWERSNFAMLLNEQREVVWTKNVSPAKGACV